MSFSFYGGQWKIFVLFWLWWWWMDCDCDLVNFPFFTSIIIFFALNTNSFHEFCTFCLHLNNRFYFLSILIHFIFSQVCLFILHRVSFVFVWIFNFSFYLSLCISAPFNSASAMLSPWLARFYDFHAIVVFLYVFLLFCFVLVFRFLSPLPTLYPNWRQWKLSA